MYALRRIEKVLRQSPQPVLHPQVVLTVEASPAQEMPARIEVGTVVAGQRSVPTRWRTTCTRPPIYNGDYGVLGPIGNAGPDGSRVRPPVLTADQARERLDLTADRFVFYRAASDDRARVLYRRYDGCYGLLVAV